MTLSQSEGQPQAKIVGFDLNTGETNEEYSLKTMDGYRGVVTNRNGHNLVDSKN